MLSGTGIYRTSVESYRLNLERRPENREYVQAVMGLLAQIKTLVDNHYASRTRKTNYEDLYYVVSQLEDNVTGEYDNPALFPLVQWLLVQTNGLDFPVPYRKVGPWTIGELAGEATKYIHDVARSLLVQIPQGLDHFGVLHDCVASNACQWIDIFTLNHDTLIEQYLEQRAISIVDGFGQPNNDIRYWSPGLYRDHVSCPLRLFKLHGSVNWFRFDDGSFGIPLNADAWHSRNPQGAPISLIDDRPEMLLGRFNKMLNYYKPVFDQLQTHLFSSLAESDRMLISGCSFGDKAINTRIITWISDVSDRRIILVHPEPTTLWDSARGAIGSHIDEWIKDSRLIVISKGFQEAGWQEIREAINQKGRRNCS